MKSSEYLDKIRKNFSLYILQHRAIPSVTDGLKAGARRVLWTARDGKKYKSATLAGATMPIHPHALPEGAINTLTAPYKNNIPLFDGEGAFGTLLAPSAYGASRYTSVKLSAFAKDVVLADIDIIPMQDNYDNTLREPKHFLPLIPMVLLNAQEGIAVGFASNIVPRGLEDIITRQINTLQGKQPKPILPSLSPIQQKAITIVKGRYEFIGTYEKPNATTIIITNLPYGISHEQYIKKLVMMVDKDNIKEFTDDSKDSYNIKVRFKKGVLRTKSDNEILKLLHLHAFVSENLNVLDFDGTTVWQPTDLEIIKEFSNWRLSWYVNRYKRLSKLLKIDIQRYHDIITTIENDIGSQLPTIASRTSLKTLLNSIGVVHVDYIADLPLYRLTTHEKSKVTSKLSKAEKLLNSYTAILDSKDERTKIYIKELRQILANHKKSKYTEV